MKSQVQGYGYNERLFSGGVRAKLHLARFRWLQAEMMRLSCSIDTVLELGCFDGKLIDYLPQKPLRYVGFDANWEGGLDVAKARWSQEPNYQFFQVSSPEEIRLNDADIFHMAVVMETIEHIPPQMVDQYFYNIAQHLEGYLFITVPNEKGIVFLTKWLTKRILSKDFEPYSFSELVNATIGRMELVARHERKGFDYESLIQKVAKHFDIEKVSGHPLEFLPPSLCFGIGIVAKSKPPQNL